MRSIGIGDGGDDQLSTYRAAIIGGRLRIRVVSVTSLAAAAPGIGMIAPEEVRGSMGTLCTQRLGVVNE